MDINLIKSLPSIVKPRYFTLIDKTMYRKGELEKIERSRAKLYKYEFTKAKEFF